MAAGNKQTEPESTQQEDTQNEKETAKWQEHEQEHAQGQEQEMIIQAIGRQGRGAENKPAEETRGI